MAWMIGVDRVLSSSSTNATKNMIDSGVAGRNMLAAGCGCGSSECGAVS